LKGDAEIEVDGYEFQLHAGESVGIPSGARHRIRNGAAANLEFIEVQVGDLISEDDIERFNDAGEHV
jgi:mannose-6-phosphate isomerase-like protein (cupin superfamily)